MLAVVICTAAATAYAMTAHKVYEASADMLVTPVPDDQTAVLGLGLLRKATDPTRDVTTASLMIDNTSVAQRVQRDLRTRESVDSLLQKVRVDPVAQSSIVSITASAGSPRQAQQIANAFAQAAVIERTDRLHRELDPAIRVMRERIRQITGNQAQTANTVATQPLYQQLAALEGLRSAPDPTLRVETPATAPASPSSPRVKLSLAAGVIAGLLIGIAGAFALRALDPRGNRENRLDAMGLSVLTRVPNLTRSSRSRHAFDESFRFLRTMLRFAADEPIPTIAVTSTSEREGKTTTSFQLAMATLEAGQTVMLVEADPYRPGLTALIESDTNGEPRPGLLEYLSGLAELEEIVQSTMVPGLAFVPAGSLQRESITGLLERERGRSFVRNLSDLADVVILDCPPVGARSDAILLASYADAVLLIVDLKQSAERDVAETVDRLRRTSAHLAGIVINRDESGAASYEYLPNTEKRRGRALSMRR